VPREPARAVAHRPAAHRRVEVLDEERHAAERAVRERARGVAARVVEALEDDRVEAPVVALDARDRGLDELRGRDLPAPHQVCEPESIEVGVFAEGHARHLLPSVAFTRS
jgi:hypothetical protein